ncbi:formyltransferase family protein [Pseudoalteromonas sp. SA25]|uniref:formyltransferase family protein n=1 Tax=Pseudoalteromonas sp. SA25 TaxID=2686347 RepID=UPI0013FE09CF|nr:formyltransferase family protein [Pseudoalteromonas sp. SA25]
MYFSSVNILVDNESWVLPYAKNLYGKLKEFNLEVKLVRSQNELKNADVTFFLGCIQVVTPRNLAKSKFNLVVHESALPKGKGFAPMAWQIINGSNTIPISLIEADDKVDNGKIWLQKKIYLKGDELYLEWRKLQGEATVSICIEFILQYKNLIPHEQVGESTIFKKRTAKDSELNTDLSIAQQFDLLRTVDNDNFPAFIYYRGYKYEILIKKKL